MCNISENLTSKTKNFIFQNNWYFCMYMRIIHTFFSITPCIRSMHQYQPEGQGPVVDFGQGLFEFCQPQFDWKFYIFIMRKSFNKPCTIFQHDHFVLILECKIPILIPDMLMEEGAFQRKNLGIPCYWFKFI